MYVLIYVLGNYFKTSIFINKTCEIKLLKHARYLLYIDEKTNKDELL